MSDTKVWRWCIETDDRIGMVRDVVAEIAKVSGNLEAMEVVAGRVFVRFSMRSNEQSILRRTLENILDVKQVDSIDSLPFEAGEQALLKRVMRQDGHGQGLSFDSLVYKSQTMAKIVRNGKVAAQTDAPVLILGESGTGKELLARAIHQGSSRVSRRFVPVNCAALPEALVESELFGYAEGAFTGAVRGGRPGLFEVAAGGTLFLDELGELNGALQAKLLRVLQDGEIRRVGSSTASYVNVRIVAATNRNLASMVETGAFREDLYYRLNVLSLEMPPLRERVEDIAVLAEQFLATLSQKLNRNLTLSRESAVRLLAYRYPGNVRELHNILERAAYLSDEDVISPEHLVGVPRHPVVPNGSNAPVKGRVSQNSAVSLRDLVQAYERQVVREALNQHGSLRRAARALGVSHTTLRNKLATAQTSEPSRTDKHME